MNSVKKNHSAYKLCFPPTCYCSINYFFTSYTLTSTSFRVTKFSWRGAYTWKVTAHLGFSAQHISSAHTPAKKVNTLLQETYTTLHTTARTKADAIKQCQSTAICRSDSDACSMNCEAEYSLLKCRASSKIKHNRRRNFSWTRAEMQICHITWALIILAWIISVS